jgi:hypothetical protein
MLLASCIGEQEGSVVDDVQLLFDIIDEDDVAVDEVEEEVDEEAAPPS